MKENFKAYFLDIMTILMPGAFLVATLLNIESIKVLFCHFFGPLKTDWVKAAVYLGTSYVAGHIIYMFASMLDDIVYEKVHPVFWKDKSLTAYIIKKKEEITGISSRKVINAFKWSCAWLLKNQPALYGSVERYFAESKFFRSLSVVFFLSFFLLLKTSLDFWIIAITLPMLSLFSLIRYITQRQKSIETAYHAVIVSSKASFPSSPDSKVLADISRYNADVEKKAPYERSRLAITFYQAGVFFRRLSKSLQSVFLLNKLDLAEVADELSFSYEVRWFTDDAAKFAGILNWFRHQEAQLGGNITEQRTDEYLVIPVGKEMSVKQRSGKIEIKKLLKRLPDCYSPAATITGELEIWEKTGFKHQPDVNSFILKLFSTKEIGISGFNWKKIHKTRMLVKAASGKNGGLQLFPPSERLASGCQVEHTTLDLGDNKILFSFAVEWFGERTLQLYDPLIKEICGSTKLEEAESFAYNRLLEKYF
ncbi:MAG: hypothetical protein KF862_22870 [Chitinophagaceae bacterium]|nr:hypothetical protein [Chitinophagaceae bacterium]